MRGSVCGVLCVVAIAVGIAPVHAYTAPPVDRPVTFSVVNQNTSLIPCQSDGLPYQLRGHLVSPTALTDTRHAAISLFVQGSGGGQYFHFQAVPGYDTLTEMARRGHVALVVDNLGYHDSDIPDGNAVCTGSQVDMLHQVVEQLRAGTYDDGDGDGRGPAFDRVAMLGHSFGGVYIESEAASFHDIDALVSVDWAGEGYPLIEAGPSLKDFGVRCATGGEPKWDDHGAGGYGLVFTADDFHAFLSYNVAPEVQDAVIRMYERDYCGVGPSIHAIADNHLLNATIDVAVLLTFGDPGLNWAPGTAAAERSQFASSPDVRVAIVPDCGHMIYLCRNRATFLQIIDDWLSRRGF